MPVDKSEKSSSSEKSATVAATAVTPPPSTPVSSAASSTGSKGSPDKQKQIKKMLQARARRASLFKSWWFKLGAFLGLSLVALLVTFVFMRKREGRPLLPWKHHFPAPASEEEREFQELQKWLIDGGSKIIDTLRLADSSMDSVRGVYTTSTMTYNTQVMAIPYKRLITTEMCKNYESGKRYLEKNKGDWIVQLAIVLLEEEDIGEKSAWWPYIKMLPKDLNNFPMFFPKNLIDELQGSQTLNTIKFRRQNYRNYYDSVKNAYPEWKFTFDQFVRAILLVNSRNFGIDVKGVSTNALVPLADMLNHEMPPAPTTWQFDEKLDAFTVVVTTPKGISSMSPVHDSYGHRCNNRLFVGYSFSLPDNPANTAIIDDHQVMIGWQNRENQYFVAMMRQEALIKTGSDQQITSLAPISIENEIDAFKIASNGAERALAAFKTSIEEDQRLLSSSKDLDFNMKNILTVRLGEKVVLTWIKEVSDRIVELASLGSVDEINRALQAESDPRSADWYVSRFIIPLKLSESEAPAEVQEETPSEEAPAAAAAVSDEDLKVEL